MIAYTAVTKFLLYPTFLSYTSGRDLLFSALFVLLFQGVIIWALSYLCSRTDMTFFELLKNTFGTIAAKIIMGFFALFFLVMTLYPLLEQMLYVHAVFYDTVPSLGLFLPFFFFGLYATSRKFTNIGRSADIALPIFIFCLVVIMSMSVTEVKWDAFLPMFKTPPKKIFGGAVSSLFRFIEPAYLLMFMGRFKYKKGDAAKITLSYAFGGLLVLFVLAVFYGIYGGIAPSRQFAISKISLFFPSIDELGRVDFIILYVLEIVMLFALVLNMQLAAYCISECTGYQNYDIISLVVNAVMITCVFVFNSSFGGIADFYSKWLWIAAVIFASLIPVCSWLLRRRARYE